MTALFVELVEVAGAVAVPLAEVELIMTYPFCLVYCAGLFLLADG